MANYYQDIDIYGREESGGKPFELYNEEAIKNAFTLWFTSKAGEFLRNPEAGGILDRILFKNMEGTSIGLWLFSIKNALYAQFYPALDIIDLNLEKDYTQRFLRLELKYRISISNQVQNLEIFTKDLTPVVEQKQQNVQYTDVNLLMFCTIRKPDMENDLLVYDTEASMWRWGIYNFTNFSTSDIKYDEILSMCNE